MSENVKWLREIASGLSVGSYDPADNLMASAMNDVLRGQFTACADEIESLQSRLDATTEQNRYLRSWIRELRDTQEERGRGPADPLYSMLLERIEPLMSADPAADAGDGIRLLELVDLCEAYEKRVVEILENKSASGLDTL